MAAHLGGTDAWAAITRALTKRNGRAVAAVAYIGAEAPSLMPLRKGDLLVCDAEDETVKNRATSAAALRAYRRRGVEIRSVPGLHAKAVVLRKRAFVGSANASRHSRDQLHEAVVETTDTATCRDLRVWIEELPGVPVDGARIRQLEALPLRRAPKLPKKASTFPESLDRLTILELEFGNAIWGPREETAYGKAKGVGSRQAKQALPGVGVSWDWLTEEVARAIKHGHWVTFVEDGQAAAPMLASFKTEPVRGHVLVWFAQPRVTNEHVDEEVLRKALARRGIKGHRWHRELHGRDAEAVAHLFR